MEAPETLQSAIVYFSDPDRCFEYALNLRWPNGVVSCPRCGSEQHSFIKTRRLWFCKGCKKQFTLKVGTIFEDSPLGLDKWMCAFWMLCNCKNGISSCEVARALGITQKSAWFMCIASVRLMQDDSAASCPAKSKRTKLSSAARRAICTSASVSAESPGPAARIRLPSWDCLERGGKVRTDRYPQPQEKHLQAEVRKHVEAGAALYTDALPSYSGLARSMPIRL